MPTPMMNHCGGIVCVENPPLCRDHKLTVQFWQYLLALIAGLPKQLIAVYVGGTFTPLSTSFISPCSCSRAGRTNPYALSPLSRRGGLCSVSYFVTLTSLTA